MSFWIKYLSFLFYFVAFIAVFPLSAESSASWLNLRQLPAPFSADTSFSCPAASWPHSDVGDLLTPQIPDGELQTILREIDPKRIEEYIKKLVSFGTRHTLSNQTDLSRGIGAARDWIAEQMREFAAASGGQMEVTVPNYIQGVASRVPFPVRISNIVATLKGSVDSGRTYVISGHYDTRCTDVLDYTCDAPGADDE